MLIFFVNSKINRHNKTNPYGIDPYIKLFLNNNYNPTSEQIIKLLRNGYFIDYTIVKESNIPVETLINLSKIWNNYTYNLPYTQDCLVNSFRFKNIHNIKK